MEKEDVRYQTSELGKVDQGGGGTIAYIWPALWHGGHRLRRGPAQYCTRLGRSSSKADIYETTAAIWAFLKLAG